MAYNGVTQPRFYIDEIQYLKSIGFDFEKYYQENYNNESLQGFQIKHTDISDVFGLTPGIQTNLEIPADENGNYLKKYFIDVPSLFNNLEGSDIGRYIAILNHTLPDEGLVDDHGEQNIGINFKWHTKEADPSDGDEATFSQVDRTTEGILNGSEFPINHNGSSIINFSSSSENFNPPNNMGFHRLQFHKDWGDGESIENWANFSIGAISFGIYYDLRTPDLDLNVTTEFDGFDSVDTLGGGTLTNIRHTGSPWWYDKNGNKSEPFSVGQSTGLTKRNGRRVWSLKFSYMSDTDVFPSNFMSNNYYEHSSADSVDTIYSNAGDLSDDTNDFRYTLEESNSFVSQVINRVGNGQRFLFQANKNNNNPDQFAICVLDSEAFGVRQTGLRTYEFSMKIREVW